MYNRTAAVAMDGDGNEVVDENTVAIRVEGDGLAEDGIHDGDWLLVDPMELVRVGDIGVVRRDNGIVIAHVGEGEQGIAKVTAIVRRL